MPQKNSLFNSPCANLIARSANLAASAIPCPAGLGHNDGMHRLRAFLLALPLFCNWVAAAEAEAILDTAERYAQLQTQGLPGKVSIHLGKLDAARLAPCTAMEAYTPVGARMIGKTSIGVRCLGPNIWNVLVAVEIAVSGNYVTTARAILAGQPIQASDLAVLSGDVSRLPTGIIADPASAIGKTLRNSLGAGLYLRADQLISPIVIRQGQSVRVISKGSGFSVSGEGKAITNAAAGQTVQIRMSSGQTVSGIARADGSAEISF